MAIKIGSTIFPSVHGHSQHTDRTRRIVIGVGSLEPSDGASYPVSRYWGVEFRDAQTDVAVGHFAIPKDYVSGGQLKAIFSSLAGDTGGDYRIGLITSLVRVGENITYPCNTYYTWNQPATPSDSAEEDMYDLSSDIQADDIVGVELTRYGGAGADTATDTMVLHAIIFEYTADM